MLVLIIKTEVLDLFPAHNCMLVLKQLLSVFISPKKIHRMWKENQIKQRTTNPHFTGK